MRAIKTRELTVKYGSQKSYYKKAWIAYYSSGDVDFISYDSVVGGVRDGVVFLNGYYSRTTSIHQYEFIRQFDLDTKITSYAKSELEKYYIEGVK